MVTFTQAQQQLRKWLSPTRLRLVRGEIRQLPRILWENEKIECAVQGWYQGGLVLLVATNRRLLLIDHKWLDTKVDDYPYTRISSIEHDCNIWMGKLVISMPGGDMVVHRIDAETLRTFARIVMDHITRSQSQTHPTQPVNNNLQILALMLDKGLLTDEEFRAQWQNIIGAHTPERTFLDYPTSQS